MLHTGALYTVVHGTENKLAGRKEASAHYLQKVSVHSQSPRPTPDCTVALENDPIRSEKLCSGTGRDTSLEKSHLKQVWDILRSLLVLSFKAGNVEKCLQFYSQNPLRNFDLQNQEEFSFKYRAGNRIARLALHVFESNLCFFFSPRCIY